MVQFKQQFKNYGIAIASVLTALVLMVALEPLIQVANTSFLLFFGAVMLSAWYGGHYGGILATVLSAILANYFFMGPRFELDLSFASIFRMGIFVFQGVVFSILVGSLHTAQKQVKRSLRQRERAEAELWDSEADFRAVFNVTSVGQIQADVKSRCLLRVNAAFCEMVGYSESELLTMTVDDLIHPDDREQDREQYLNLLRQAINDYQFEKRYLRKDGSVLWVLTTGNIIRNGTGQPLRIVAVIQDITERKQIEADLRLNRDRLAFVLQATGIGLWLNPLPLGELNWDTKTRELFFVSQEVQPTLELFWSRVHPEDREPTRLAVEAALRDKTLYAIDHRAVHPATGEIRWTRSAGKATYAPDGTPLHFDGISYDISDHKASEASLRENEERFRTLADNISQFAWMADATGWLFWYNQRWFEYTGTTLEQMQGWGIDCVVEHFRHCLETGEDWEDTFPLRSKAGEYRWFLSRAIPIRDEAGNVLRWFGTNTDITDLRRVEAELRQKNAILDVINESAPTPIFVKDRQGRIIYANPATLEVLGKTADEVIGARDCDLSPNSEDAAKVMDNDQRIMATGKTEVVEESPDGFRTFLGMKAPYRNEAGEVIGLIGISNDITDRVQLERDRTRILEQEQAAREAAEQANRIKDEFLAVLSHELRSPLNPILGWTKLLQSQSYTPEETAQALATIERNVKLQVQLIDDLLDVSRILRGKMVLNVCPVNLVTIIESALETVQLAAEAKGIQIRTHLDEKVGTVSGDSTRLQQIVWNLLTNAIKFTPQDGHIEVRLHRVENFAQLEVQDTGKGIKPEFLPYVFDSFRQEDGAITRKFGGLGLGLAIVRHLTEQHGGTITVESTGEGQGATFMVRFPLQPTTPEGLPASPAPAQALDLRQLKILVVDDEADMRELMQVALVSYGAQVQIAGSAMEALHQLESWRPQVLISDIGMPEMDGYMLLRKVRRLPPEQGGQIPAIALTAYAGEFDQQLALAAGFQKHVAKPVEPDQLVEAIVTLMSQSTSHFKDR
jgi:PAS domain S-box-containing protein